MKKVILEQFELSFFFSRGGQSPYTCIYSETEDYKLSIDYLVYDIPELLRLMIIKKELMNDDLVNYYYKNSNNSLCLVLEWNELVRKVVRISSSKELDIIDLQEQIADKKELISGFFKKSYFKHQEKHETI